MFYFVGFFAHDLSLFRFRLDVCPNDSICFQSSQQWQFLQLFLKQNFVVAAHVFARRHQRSLLFTLPPENPACISHESDQVYLRLCSFQLYFFPIRFPAAAVAIAAARHCTRCDSVQTNSFESTRNLTKIHSMLMILLEQFMRQWRNRTIVAISSYIRTCQSQGFP